MPFQLIFIVAAVGGGAGGGGGGGDCDSGLVKNWKMSKKKKEKTSLSG